MSPQHTLVRAGLAFLVVACGRTRDVGIRELALDSRTPLQSTLIRLPREGGVVRAYRASGLDETTWMSLEKLPPLDRLVGADLEQHLVYALDQKRNVVAVDLDSRRIRTVLPGARYASVGPDGTLYAIDSAGGVTRVLRRTPLRFRAKLVGTPRALFGTMDGNLLAFLAGKSGGLTMLSPNEPAAKVPLPAGDPAATFWGDLVAVAADSGVVIYQPDGKAAPAPLGIGGRPEAVVFSPSGHRLYVAGGSDGIRIVDRFGRNAIGQIDLPGPAEALRSDLYGIWLLARPSQSEADSVWVVDVVAGRLLGGTASRWGADLPRMAGPSTLVVRRGKDVVGLRASAAGLQETGRVVGGAGDLWIGVPWSPEGEPQVFPAESDSTVVASTDSGGPAAPGIYLQVSSSQNGSWAANLSEQLRGAGLPAAVLDPKDSGDPYRVVLGPYATREEAEEASRSIGRPSFIITAQGDPGR